MVSAVLVVSDPTVLVVSDVSVVAMGTVAEYRYLQSDTHGLQLS